MGSLKFEKRNLRKRTINLLLFLGLLLLFSGCEQAGPPASNDLSNSEPNPPAPGFNLSGSDPKAIAIADEVMEAMGGRAAWDETRYLSWTFFGRRNLLWDREGQKARIEVPEDSTIYLLDLKEGKGKVQIGGRLLLEPDSLSAFISQGQALLINDSYWLVMPFKLKDSGVTLNYLQEQDIQPDSTGATIKCDALELLFQDVGITPQNKYHVFVDKETKLVRMWAYFSNATDRSPSIITPWNDYREYGDILLSGDRARGQLTNIAVYKNVPKEAFTSFKKPNPMAFR